ncbi:hypothetical protein J6590_014961 [Homalodisca vitripennis]|nr:hypothetical protein J6590_014961 [Homalodisca vitripennis]
MPFSGLNKKPMLINKHLLLHTCFPTPFENVIFGLPVLNKISAALLSSTPMSEGHQAVGYGCHENIRLSQQPCVTRRAYSAVLRAYSRGRGRGPPWKRIFPVDPFHVAPQVAPDHFIMRRNSGSVLRLKGTDHLGLCNEVVNRYFEVFKLWGTSW